MMGGFRLALRRLSGDRLALTVPVTFRFVLLAIGLLVGLALLATSPPGLRGIWVPSNAFPLAFGGISLLGAAYRESWTFDRGRDALIATTGILLFQKRRRYTISQLTRLELGQFLRGRPYAAPGSKPGLLARPMLTLTLHTREGGVHRLELFSYSQRERARLLARRIAEYCGIACIDESAGPP
jgi:hypothetical protein